jgi:2-acylglycerol O-acyltransferase 2
MASKDVKMKDMDVFSHIFAALTLGLLSGWYYFVLILLPILVYWSYYSRTAASFLAFIIAITIIPLDYTPRPKFMTAWFWKIWRDYFDFQADISTIKLEKGKKYMFFEFPHGIFPMGQFISASVIDVLFPGDMICGLAADVIFAFPSKHIPF